MCALNHDEPSIIIQLRAAITRMASQATHDVAQRLIKHTGQITIYIYIFFFLSKNSDNEGQVF